MKILVAGSRGQMAAALTEASTNAGLDLVAIGRPNLDLTEPRSLERAFDRVSPDYVVNAAAYTAVDNAEGEADVCMQVNRDGPARLAALCAARRIPLLHISSDYVFDGAKGSPYTETDETQPLNSYGRSKLAGERAVAEANPRHIVLRTSWVHSPVGQNFVRTMLRHAESRDEVAVVDDQWGCPSYAPHVAAGILGIIRQLNERSADSDPWGIYNIAGGGATTWCGLAREVFAQSGRRGGPTASVRPISTADYPSAALRPANSQLNCEKARRIFGITLPAWQQGVAQCLDRLLGPQGTASQQTENSI